MTVKPNKFKSITISEKKIIQAQVFMKNDFLKIASVAELIKLHINSQLNLNLYIGSICKFVSKQLNALLKEKWFSGFEERKIYILSNFNNRSFNNRSKSELKVTKIDMKNCCECFQLPYSSYLNI